MKTALRNWIAALGMLVLVAGCRGGDSAGSLRVRVVDDDFVRIPNVTVVLGNSDGAMITYGTTDAIGEYTFSSPPANATVTTARSCMKADGSPSNDLSIMYDINGSAVTVFHECRDAASTALGTITINVANVLPTVTSNTIYVGGDKKWAYGLVTQRTYTVYEDQFQNDGKLSLVVTGEDAAGNPVGYGMLLDQTFTDGMSVNITVDQPFSFIQYTLTNIPPTTIELLNSAYADRKDQSLYAWLRAFSLSSALTSTTQKVAYIPGVDDGVWYNAYAYLDTNANGRSESMISFGIYDNTGGVPSDQSFDFSQIALLSNLVVSYGTGTATPTFTWSGVNANSCMIWGPEGLASLNTSTTTKLSFTFMASPTRTSLVFPQLPDVLSAFRPKEIEGVGVGSSTMSLYAGYSDYISRLDQYSEGTWSLPSSYTYSYSIVSYSSSTSLAPAMNKSAGSTSRPMMRRFGPMIR